MPSKEGENKKKLEETNVAIFNIDKQRKGASQ
jgi:hypothetical protein